MNDITRYAYRGGSEPTKLATSPYRIIVENRVVAEQKCRSPELDAILKTISLAINTIWFTHKLKKPTRGNYLKSVTSFYSWLNDIEPRPSLQLLKDYEIFEVSNLGLKPQSSNAKRVLSLLRKGRLEAHGLSVAERRYINGLCLRSRLLPNEASEPYNLTQWFSKHPWIRQEMGDEYLKLASPKRLIKSFSGVIALTLIMLLENRKRLLSDHKVKELYLTCCADHTSSRKPQKLIAQLLQLLHPDSNNDIDQLAWVTWAECIKPAHEKQLQNLLSISGSDGFVDVLAGKSKSYPYTRPVLYKSAYPSTLEQLLLYWLLCTLAIQPTDANNLTRNDIARVKNGRGRTRFIRIGYLKGRGGKEHEPPLLRSGEIVFEAIDLYLNTIPNDQKALFTETMVKGFWLINPYYSDKSTLVNTPLSTLVKLWSNVDIKKHLSSRLNHDGNNDLFLKAFMCFTGGDVLTFTDWLAQSGTNRFYTDYQKVIDRSVPQLCFSGTHIKNTSVYSRSDTYREDDLVNENSHTSLTEKLSYLTDNNQEWVNQVGRITRMVMQDIESHAFAPTTSIIEADVLDKTLRTKIIKNSSDKVKTNTIGGLASSIPEAQDELLVIDSPENAVFMMHYINQAESKYRSLANKNPRFLASTVLVNVEWMHHCLTHFSPENIKEAKKRIKKIGSVLPELFVHELSEDISL